MGEPKIMENAWIGGIGMKLGGKNKQKSYIRDINNWNGFRSIGEGGVNYEK